MKNSGEKINSNQTIGRKVVWALDAFGEVKAQKGAALLVKTLQGLLKSAIHPVFVLTPPSIPFAGDREYLTFFIPQAEKNLQNLLNRYQVKPAEVPKILVQNYGHTRKNVKAFLSYCEKIEPFAIVTSTQARTGLGRLFLGSFAETLALQSKIPLFIVGPGAQVSKEFYNILYPTDFSKSSELAFQHVLGLAEYSSAKVILFHQFQAEKPIEVPLNVLHQKNGVWSPAIERLGNRELARIKRQAEKWQKLAHSKNVKCDFEIRYGLRNIAECVLEFANKLKPSIIALAAVHGPMSAALSGSTSRWIIRSAQVPVWVQYIASKD